jgi:signal transduction histidine kinase
MKIQEYKTLLNAAFHGDTPKERLKSLLFAIRDTLVVENINSVVIWITNHRDDSPEEALILLQKDSIKFLQENNDESFDNNVNNISLEAAYTIKIPMSSSSQQEIIGYLHFSSQPIISKDWLQTLTNLIGRELLELRREITGNILYSMLDSYRKGVFQVTKLLGQQALDELGENIAKAFCNRSLCLLLYGLQNWRDPNGLPLATFQGNQQPIETIQDNFYQLLHKNIYECLRQNQENSTDGKIACEITPSGIPKEYNKSIFYLVVQPLVHLKESDDSGIPYIATVFITEPENRLNDFELDFLDKFLQEFQRILRLRDEFKLMNGMYDLIHDFPFFSSPVEVANSVAKYLNKSFNASEVAILERRGNFLSVIAKDEDVKLKDVPPLHIPTTKALVCDVAKTRISSYIKDVRKEDTYLTVVTSTKTQFTVPLVWQGDLVGVLLVGLSVIDGLESRHKEIIEILAGFCAAAIKVSRRAAEERAIHYMLGEVLTSAALKINYVIQGDEITSANHSKLQAAFDLLNQSQQFIERLQIAQSSVGQEKRIDLRDIVNKIGEPSFLTSWRQEHLDHSIIIIPFSQPLIAYVYEEGMLIALHNIVLNGLEAMEGKSGKVTISISVENIEYENGARIVPFGVIKITDEGKGIPLSEQVEIFDLFSSSKLNHLGSGLNIAKRFIEGFGGKIELHSLPDKGSEFSLWIPIKQRRSKR